MGLKRILAGMLVACGLFYFNPTASATVAGKVELVEGEVKVTRGDTEIAPKVDDAIEEGDTIFTGKDGELHIRMEDSGYIAVRGNTRMKIDAYVAEGGENDQAAFSLFKGTFRSITGWIAKYNRGNYVVKAPTATIGIRGTDHEPLYIPEDARDAEGEPGLYDKVNEGETTIQNPRGRIFVKPNQSGFVPFHGRVAPKILTRIPKFFRPGVHEKRIVERRDILRNQFEQHRKQRQKEIQEKRAEMKKAAVEKRKEQRAEKREGLRKMQQERMSEQKKRQMELRRDETKKKQQEREERDQEKMRLKGEREKQLQEPGQKEQQPEQKHREPKRERHRGRARDER